MRKHQYYPSTYLKAVDLPKDGTVVPATIDEVLLEEVGKEQKKKPVIHFTNHGLKPMVCNVTNYERISDLFKDDESDHWPGKTIGLYRTWIEFGGEETECVRVKAAPAKAAQPRAKVASRKAALDPTEHEKAHYDREFGPPPDDEIAATTEAY